MEPRVVPEGCVEFGGVGTMVLRVVDLHGASVDMGLQSIVFESEFRKLEGVGHETGLLFDETSLALMGPLPNGHVVHPIRKRFTCKKPADLFPRNSMVGSFGPRG